MAKRRHRQAPSKGQPKSDFPGFRRWLSPRREIVHRWMAWGWIIFALALVMRLLFWQATPDAEWSHSAYYKGDAPIWLDYARAIQQDVPYELGLPLRPPGNGYLLAALWDGDANHLGRLKLLWCLLGAATASLFYAAARRSFGVWVGCLVGFGVAIGHGWMVLSTSLNNETPYLFLVAWSLYFLPSLHAAVKPQSWRLLLWGGVQAVACLVRVEHALFFGFLMLWLLRHWTDAATPRRWRRVGLASGLVAVAFVTVLAPWHLQAWDACRRFNTEEPEVNAATEQAYRQVEQALQGMRWQDDAVAERQGLPAASRRAMGNFVAATVFVRGQREVRAADFAILEEAFGSRPTPLAEHPFIALYGGLNFYLANNPEAPAGFSRGPLNAPPPLTGGAGRYPAPLIGGLPPPDLALSYPPHLDIVNLGYRKGLAWIVDQPMAFAAHLWQKGRIFWHGATLGIGGYNLPFGNGGLRHRVDLVVPHRTTAVILWQLAWLAVLLWGSWRLLRLRQWAFLPWAAWLASKVVVTAAFFGYARQGVGVSPVLFLLLAVLIEAATRRSDPWQRRRVTWGLVVLGLVLAVECFRFLQPPVLVLGGRPVGEVDPWPTQHHEGRILEAR